MVDATMDIDLQLIDINGLGYAAMYQPNLAKLSFEGQPTGGIHGAITSVLSALASRPTAMPVVLWDGHAQWRKDLYDEYKANRKDDPDKLAVREAYEKQVPIIQLLLAALGIPQVRCGTAEADDVAGVLCRWLDPSWRIELISRDTDWWQALREGVVWYSPLSKSYVDLAKLQDPGNGLSDGHFLSTAEYLSAKALAGDSSDNIEGIEKVGLKTAAKIMREHGGTLEQFWAAVDAGLNVKGVVAQRVASEASRAIYRRNIELMDWARAPDLDTELLAFTGRTACWDDVKVLCEAFGLSRIPQQARNALAHEPDWSLPFAAVDAALHHHRLQPVLRPTVASAAEPVNAAA